jgi:hypothetical protein
MKLVLTTKLSCAKEVIEIEGFAFADPIDNEDLNAYIREFAKDNNVTESSVEYEVLPD